MSHATTNPDTAKGDAALASSIGSPLVLSTFPGIGLLDMAFESAGFTVVRGPDLLWGGDARRFHCPHGKFDGIIGGPPCQKHSTFSRINRAAGNAIAQDLVPEFLRMVDEGQPQFFLMENAPAVPTVSIPGYQVQVITLNARWFGLEQARRRKIQFGTRSGVKIHPRFEALEPAVKESTCLASEGAAGRITTRVVEGRKKSVYRPRRSFDRFCQLQGLPADFLKDAPFTEEAKYRVVGNGVPLPMGRALADAIRESMYPENEKGEL